MSKHFLLEIEDNGFSYERNRQSIAREVALDGIYVIRTNVAEENLSAADTVRQYKQLSAVEHAFRSWKSADLKVRPIHIIWPIGYVRMCFCACWPTTRNGICVRRGRRCCSPVPILKPGKRGATRDLRLFTQAA